MNFFKSFCVSFFLFGCFPVIAQEVPGVISFTDGPILQSWMITQDCEGIIYVANSSGIMIYNGFSWQKLSLPANQIPRAIYTGQDCKVYAGGFETLGYIDRIDPLNPTFISISDSLLEGTNQEIWNLFGTDDKIIAQSFSNAYLFDYQLLIPVAVPSNIMLGNSLKGRLFLPKITKGLLEFNQNAKQFNEMPGSTALPEGSKIVSVQNFTDKNTLALATQYNGIYKYAAGQLSAIENDFIDKLKREQINKMIRLRNGDYIIGTILNGLYVTSDFEEVKYHINRSTGLTNNTVLSLFEDKVGDLWVGLDKGVNLIKLSEPVFRYYDLQGVLGTIFTSIEYRGSQYLGTNKGLFVKTADEKYKLVDNSQGQVWSLLKAGGDLLCGHNSGTYLVDDPDFTKVSTITGGWWMEQLDSNRIIQSSYIGLVLLERSKDEWKVKKRLENGNILIERFELSGNKLVGFHPHYGLCVLQLNEDFTKVEHQTIIDKIDGTTVNPSIILSKINSEIYVFFENDIFKYADDNFQKIAINYLSPQENKNELLDKYKLYLQLAGMNKEGFAINFRYLPNAIGRNGYLINYEDGYLIFTDSYLKEKQSLAGIFPDVVYANQLKINYDTSKLLSLDPKQNDLFLQLGDHFYHTSHTVLEYQLDGWDEQWYELPKDGKLNFINLDDGDYTLKIRSNKESRNLLRMRIAPQWYESWPGYLLYFALFLSTLKSFQLWSKRKLRIETEKLQAEKDREMESIKIKTKNKELRQELLYKTKMLANSAMTLIQKNNMLNELKSMIKKQDDTQLWQSGRPKQKILNIIQRSINSDQDWEIFERNFEEVHEDFLNQLKDAYPDITPGEMRMAAYIRMNLSSKEIAPLLNISIRSVENKRYRLRKKMGLTASTSLSEHLMRL